MRYLFTPSTPPPVLLLYALFVNGEETFCQLVLYRFVSVICIFLPSVAFLDQFPERVLPRLRLLSFYILIYYLSQEIPAPFHLLFSPVSHVVYHGVILHCGEELDEPTAGRSDLLQFRIVFVVLQLVPGGTWATFVQQECTGFSVLIVS